MNFLTGPDLVLFAGLLIIAAAVAQDSKASTRCLESALEIASDSRQRWVIRSRSRLMGVESTIASTSQESRGKNS